jgi:hypothetical protein
MHRPLQLPLPLLTYSDMLAVAQGIKMPDSVAKDRCFRRAIADIGGYPRALELFYEQIDEQNRQ